jgi:hypothetical protein
MLERHSLRSIYHPDSQLFSGQPGKAGAPLGC